MTEEAHDDEPSSGEPIRQSATPPELDARPARRSKLIWALGASVAILTVVVAGLVGFLIGNSTHETEPAFGPTPTAQSLTLRQTADKFLGDVRVAETRGEKAAWDAMKVHAEPACGALLDGLYAAFGGPGDGTTETVGAAGSKWHHIVAVEEDGDRGTVVMRSDGENETMHWVRRNAVWRFTCEGIFDQTPSATTATSTTVPQVTSEPQPAPPPAHTSQAVVVGEYCSSRGATAQTTADGSVAYCARLAGTDAYIWSLTPGLAANPEAQQRLLPADGAPPPAGDICYDPAATATDLQGQAIFCNPSSDGNYFQWQLEP